MLHTPHKVRGYMDPDRPNELNKDAIATAAGQDSYYLIS